MVLLQWLVGLKHILTSLNNYLGLITLVVVLWAVYTYIKQKKDNKRDIARLILQEIRYSEDKVRNYTENTQAGFRLYEKLLPTNNWSPNIHLFLDDLEQAQVDLISTFYSKVSYIDTVIGYISNRKNNPQLVPQQGAPVITSGGPDMPGTRVVNPPPQLTIIDPGTSQQILSEVVLGVEFLYNSSAADKFRKITQKRWYQI